MSAVEHGEGPPEPTHAYCRRTLLSLIEDKQYQRALDFTDMLAVHPYTTESRQVWLHGYGDAMHHILLAKTTTAFREVR